MGLTEPILSAYSASAALTRDPQRIAERVKNATYTTLGVFRSQQARVKSLLGPQWVNRRLDVIDDSVRETPQNDTIRVEFTTAVYNFARYIGKQQWIESPHGTLRRRQP